MMKQKGNTLYLECYSGISGDMTAAALLDLGATEKNIRETLGKLPLSGYRIEVSRVREQGLDACDFNVIIEENQESKKHAEHYGHRTWKEIEQLLDMSELEPRVLERSKKMFRIVAEAEGKVHGCPPEKVHFHEVGAVDSIVDIVTIAACLEELHIEKILVSQIWEGQGHVNCQHGILPVPVPAVLEIISKHHLPLKQTGMKGERVTPTGAAVAALSEGKQPENFLVKGIGLGAGKRKYPEGSLLRAMLIEEEPEGNAWLLESNIDDCAGEVLGRTMECLLAAGAKEVYYTPIYMKKNRPAYKLSLICEEDQIRNLEALLFRETTTIGVRRFRMQREERQRREK